MFNWNSHLEHWKRLWCTFRAFICVIHGSTLSSLTFYNWYLVLIMLLCCSLSDKDIARAYNVGSESDQNFIHNLALFFLAFFKNHLSAVENPELHNSLAEAHNILVRIATVQDVEVFKITLEYWHLLATDLHNEVSTILAGPLLVGGHSMAKSSPRRQLYAPVLSKVRSVMVSRMAKPEEVCEMTYNHCHAPHWGVITTIIDPLLHYTVLSCTW